MESGNIPYEIRGLCQWMTWKYIGGQKIPLQVDGSRARTNDSSTFCSFDDALACPDRNGVAFVFTSSDPFCGIDLDSCYDPERGLLHPWALEIVDAFRNKAYCEISPSNTGVKLITRASKPPGSRCKKGNIECYDHSRFWCITSKILDEDFTSIEDAQVEVERFLSVHIPGSRICQDARHDSGLPATKELIERAEKYANNVPDASVGDRNKSCFSLAGHLLSLKGKHDERLSHEDVLRIVSQWNLGSGNPLPDHEVNTCVRSAAKNGRLPLDKPALEASDEDLSVLGPNIGQKPLIHRTRETDEEFFLRLTPNSGLIKGIFDYYKSIAINFSPTIGLATSISLCQTLFGRRVRSSLRGGLRINDYHVVIAPTGSGKDACESTVFGILDAADSTQHYMLPANMKSGSGLLESLSKIKAGIWVCDEFGKVLNAILNKKSPDVFKKEIGELMLKLYGASGRQYSGDGLSKGVRHAIREPHLCLLGMTTFDVFSVMAEENVKDGMWGRIAFWPVQSISNNESLDEFIDWFTGSDSEVPTELAEIVKAWRVFTPPSTAHWDDNPEPIAIRFQEPAVRDLLEYCFEIKGSTQTEAPLRQAVWSRVGARAQKLAITHRAARIDFSPTEQNWKEILVEPHDVRWAIELSDRLARISCRLVEENIQDSTLVVAMTKVMEVARSQSEFTVTELIDGRLSMPASIWSVACSKLVEMGKLTSETRRTGKKGKPPVVYSLANEETTK